MPGTTRTSCSAFVVSLHHDGFLRTSAPGLLHPGTDPGVHCVSAFPEPGSGTTAPRKRESSGPRPWLCQEASPQRGSYPSTNSPRQQPCRITATVALLRLPLVPTRFPGAPRRAHLVRPTTLLGRDRDTLEAPAEADTTRCITAGGCPTIAEAMVRNHRIHETPNRANPARPPPEGDESSRPCPPKRPESRGMTPKRHPSQVMKIPGTLLYSTVSVIDSAKPKPRASILQTEASSLSSVRRACRQSDRCVPSLPRSRGAWSGPGGPTWKPIARTRIPLSDAHRRSAACPTLPQGRSLERTT